MSLLATPGVVIPNDCLQFMVVGICYWYYYFGSETTVLFGHFNPDVIVEITNPEGVNRAEDGGYSDGTENRNHQNVIYQDARVYGHPLTGQLYCPSTTDALSPYFLSELDTVAWQTGGLDLLDYASWVPGFREIGGWPTNNWGAVYPRTGWTVQHSEPKASGIVAQRVGDIITRDDQPHVYLSILGNYLLVEDDKFTWPPDSLEENTNEEGWWEELDFGQCFLFGENDIATLRGWGGGRVADDGEYTYTLWRPYTCCEIGTGVLIKIQIMPYPYNVVTN